MDVAAYIKELLSQERFVYVPGLGTFSKSKTAVVYNEVLQSFYPPKNWIDFVEEEKQDDRLENYISRQKNISSTAAKYFIEKFVDQLKSDAVSKNLPVKEVLFPADNQFSTENKKTDTVFNDENFGLPKINLSKINKEPVFTKIEPETKQEASESFYTAFSVNSLEEQEETKPKRSTSFWFSVFLLLVICLLGVYTLYLYYPDLLSRFNQENPQEIITQKPAADTVKQMPVTTNQPKKDTAKAKVIVDTPVVPIRKTVPEPVAKDAATMETADPDLVKKSPYEIIGATFKTLKGAKKFLNQLKSKGMYVKILENTRSPLKLITFGSFQDKESAKAALQKLRARDPNSDAHIQHYK